MSSLYDLFTAYCDFIRRRHMLADSKAFPNIYKAALEMSYDNGGINRERSEEKHREEFNGYIGSARHDHATLKKIDEYLATLSEEQINVLVAGEDEERMALIALIPHDIQQKTDELFDEIFDEVC